MEDSGLVRRLRWMLSLASVTGHDVGGQSCQLLVSAEPGSEALWVSRQEPLTGPDAGEERVEVPADPFRDNAVRPCSEAEGSFLLHRAEGNGKADPGTVTGSPGAELGQAVETFLVHPGVDIMTDEQALSRRPAGKMHRRSGMFPGELAQAALALQAHLDLLAASREPRCKSVWKEEALPWGA